MIHVLKVIYIFLIDTIFFSARAMNKFYKEQLQKELVVVRNMKERQSKEIQLLEKVGPCYASVDKEEGILFVCTVLY